MPKFFTRNRAVHLITWMAAVALLGWAVSRVDRAQTWAALLRLGPFQLTVLVLINLFALAVFALRWWIILRGLGHRVGLMSLTGYRVAAFGLSYFTPGPQVGGEPLQVLLLERRHGVEREAAIASVGLEQAIGFLINFSFLALAVGALLLAGNFQDEIAVSGVVFVMLLVAAPASYLLLLYLNRRPLSELLRRVMTALGGLAQWPLCRRVHEVMADSEALASEFCRARRRHFLAAMGASSMSWLLILGEYTLLAAFLGSSLTWWQLLLGVVTKRLAYLLFLPSAIGAFEAGQVWAWGEMGLSRSVGMSVSLVIRLRDTAVAALGLLWGLRKLKLRSTAKST